MMVILEFRNEPATQAACATLFEALNPGKRWSEASGEEANKHRAAFENAFLAFYQHAKRQDYVALPQHVLEPLRRYFVDDDDLLD